MKEPIKTRRKPKRAVDDLTQDINSWWGKTFVFIKKTQVKTWQGVFVLAFVAGVAAASVWIVSFNIQTSSDAADGATLTIYTNDTNVTLENGSNLVNADVLLDSNNNNVVAVKAIVNYDPSKFQLQSWDTSNSIFASNNTCVYDGKPCEIVTNDADNGKISITLAKPSPGVKTDSGVIAQLVFRTLEVTVPSSPNFTLTYTPANAYEDSDVILDDGNGTDILSRVEDATVNVYSATCTSFDYSDWGMCQSDSTQERTVTSSFPANCYGGDPILEQDCDYSGSNVCEEVNYSDWGACQPNGTQSRTVTSRTPEDCVEPNIVLTQQCTYVAPTCTSFNYTAWSACQPDGTQTRSVTSGSPAGCTGGNPIVKQSCAYNPGTSTCTSFEYSDWGACQPNSVRYRTVTSSSPADCSGGNPKLEEGCNLTPVACSSFTYTDWSSCQSNGTQSRNALSGSPSGCFGGNLELSRSCKYESKKKEEKKDKEKPKFTDLPLFLNKSRGDMIWWKAKDNKGIEYYTYNLFETTRWGSGKVVKTKKNNFFVPATTRSGIYFLRVKAFDKAGNSKSRLITVRVR
jgi:hypothetical protein